MASPCSDSVVNAAVPGWVDWERAGPPYPLGVVEGQGIGPEVVAATLRVLEATGAAFGLRFDLDVAESVWSDGRYGPTLDEAGAAFFEASFARGAPVLCGPVGGRFVYDLRTRPESPEAASPPHQHRPGA